jgi:hypothetical protein
MKLLSWQGLSYFGTVTILLPVATQHLVVSVSLVTINFTAPPLPSPLLASCRRPQLAIHCVIYSTSSLTRPRQDRTECSLT